MADIKTTDLATTVEEASRLSLAAELYAKRLEQRVLKELEGLERHEAQAYRKEVEGLRAELVEPLNKHGGGTFRFLPTHLPIVLKGLRIFITNLRAAKGTMKALGYPKMIEELDKHASWVEAELVPRFDDQGTLPLDKAAGVA